MLCTCTCTGTRALTHLPHAPTHLLHAPTHLPLAQKGHLWRCIAAWGANLPRVRARRDAASTCSPAAADCHPFLCLAHALTSLLKSKAFVLTTLGASFTDMGYYALGAFQVRFGLWAGRRVGRTSRRAHKVGEQAGMREGGGGGLQPRWAVRQRR
eukprot:362940-Chlamydomonas_euryale.AAC.8